jgi:hypothetical protein
MIPSSLKKVIISAASNPRSAWSIVRNGAVAEFSVSAAADDCLSNNIDPASNTLVADTQKARLKLFLDDSIKPIIAETASYRCSPWSQCIYLCLPEEEARMSCRKSLTYIGSYDDNERSGELWDIGIGNDSLDFCIVVRDSELQQALKNREGDYIIDDREFLEVLVKFSPQRLLKTQFASILVKQKIPLRGEVVTGPHTHLLPNIIRNNIKFPIPIDNNLRSIIQVDPFGSIIDGDGNYYDWTGFEKDPFQLLLRDYSTNNYIQDKWFLRDEILRLLYTNDSQAIIDEYSNTQNRDIVRIAIVQIVCNKEYDLKIRKSALSLLDTLKAINSYGLKEWARSQSPELLNE